MVSVQQQSFPITEARVITQATELSAQKTSPKTAQRALPITTPAPSRASDHTASRLGIMKATIDDGLAIVSSTSNVILNDLATVNDTMANPVITKLRQTYLDYAARAARPLPHRQACAQSSA